MLAKENIKDIYRLSPMQEGMYFHALMEDRIGEYFEQLSYRIVGQLDIGIVRKSLNALLQRHDILRTVFNNKKVGVPLQVVLKEREIDFSFEDIRHIRDRSQQQQYLAQFKERDRKAGFDLHKDCLMRVSVFQLSVMDYEFIWSHHHILMDGWSVGILIAEYAEIYNSYVAGRNHQLPPVIQYRSYINWLQERDQTAAAAYWSRFLKGYAKQTGIPAQHTPATGRYLRRRVTLHSDLLQRFSALAAENQVTLNTVIQALWAILLGRYNQTRDVVFGSIISGRPSELPGVLTMIGLFINTIPVRIRMDKQLNFTELIKQVQEDALAAEVHHYYPLADIQAETDLKRTLLEHILVFENYPIAERIQEINKPAENNKSGDKEDAMAIQVDTVEQTNYDFNVVISAREQLTIHFDYNGYVYDDWFINALSSHLEQLILQVAENALIRLDDIILVQPNKAAIAAGISSSIDSTTTLITQFETQVLKTPSGIAVEDANKQISYAELNAAANRLADYLKQERGVGVHDRVGLLMDRSTDLLTGILGILKAGAAYVPVDPAYPAERISYTLKDAGVVTVITNKIADGLSEFNPVQIADTTTSNASDPATAITDNNALAYIIYTSGSTGKPKGVMVEHRQVINLLFAKGFRFDFNETDVWVLFHSVCFDFSVWEIFGCLLYGGRLLIPEKTTTRNPEDFARLISEKGVTVLNQVPTMFSHVMESITKHQLRYIIFGGEALQPGMLKSWYDRYPEVRLVNMYGITETTVHVTYKDIGLKEITAGMSNIGVPLPNVSLYIMDEEHRLLPYGIEGELVIGGLGVARGYLNQEALTAARFITDASGNRLYCSGDTGMMLPGGEVIYYGRKDDQVKIRGHRIELGEITQQLLLHEDIDQAVVVSRPDNSGQSQLVAYVVSTKEQTAASLRAFLSLPDYMLPSHYVQLKEIPVTDNGKTNYKILPAPEEHAIYAGTTYTAPVSEMEHLLVSIWQEMLGRPKIGIHDNFFETGGHSLKAIAIISRISKETGIQTELKQIFLHPTIAELATVIEAGVRQEIMDIPAAAQQAHYALSHAQRRLWILDQMQPDQSVYNIPFSWRLKFQLDIPAFENAFIQLVQRHEILRTRFIVVDGEPRQQIYDAAFKIVYKDLSALPDKEQQAQWMIKEAAASHFQLSEGPLMQVLLLQLAEDDYVFLLNMHHIISDAASLQILIKELITFYRGNTLPSLSVQYKDYAQWQLRELSGSRKELHRSYWMESFSDEIPVLNLPAGRMRPAIKGFNGDSISFLLGAETTEGLLQMGHAEGASLFMTLMSTIYTLLYIYSGQEDIIIGSPVAGREHASLEGQIGFYVNTLALRQRFNGHQPFIRLLREVRDNILSAFAHQSFPFDLLVDELALPGDMSRSPLFDVMVSLQHDTSGESADIKGFDSGLKGSKFDLNFIFRQTNDNIVLHLEYNTDLYERAAIEQMKSHYIHLLNDIIRHKEQPLHEINYLSETEKETLLADGTHTYYPQKSIIALFEEQVKATPDAIALIDENNRFSYTELNRMADSLAFHLTAFEKGSVIGILQERSAYLIVSILGILKAGCVYLPLDMSTPAARIQTILKDSHAKVLLTIADGQDFSIPAMDVISLLNTDTDNVSVLTLPDDPAYIMYTSGTTGIPKGVVITHRNVVSLVKGISYVQLSEKRKLLSTGAVSFDATTFEYWGMLLNGGQLVMCSQSVLLDIRLLKQQILQHQINLMWFTSGWFNQLLDTDITLFEGLNTILVGGDKLSPGHISKIRNRYPDMEILNGYGPTENTTFSLIYRITDTVTDNIPIGLPFENRFAYVLNHMRLPAATGISGEIYVGGAGISPGYLHDDLLTAEKFVYAEDVRLYRTGDLGYRLADGNIMFAGRKDEQVKIRGYRIETEEISAVLDRMEAVNKSIVLMREDKYLVAYVIPEGTLSSEMMETFLMQYLPEYMIPSYFIMLPAFPLTANGKTDRKKLAAMIHETDVFIAPQTTLEEKITAIWQEVLGRNRISIHDNFFRIGGHSLRATRILSRVSQELGVKIELRTIFTHPTIARLAAAVAELTGQQSDEIPLAPIQPDFVLSHSQRRLWILDQMEPGNNAYNIPFGYRFKGAFDIQAFEQAFHYLLSRHEILRTKFIAIAGEPRQQILKEHDFKLSFIDLSGNESLAAELVHNDAITGFDLSAGKLIRAGIIKMNGEDHIFTLVMHHIISDGWSMDILFKELVLAYTAFLEGEEPALPQLRMQYKDYAHWQHGRFSANAGHAQRSYWLKRFEGIIPLLELPSDHVRPPVKSYRGSIVSFELEPDIAAALLNIGQSADTSLFMTLLTTVYILLYRYSGQDDIIVGTPVAGREHPELEGQIGFYVNTLALRQEISADDSFMQLLQKVRENMLSAYEHQQYPFDLLLEELDLQADLSRSPLFDVMVVVQNAALQDNDLKLESYHTNTEVSKFDLSFGFREQNGHISAELNYNTDIFGHGQMERMRDHYQQLLYAIVNNSSTAVKELNYLSEKDQEQLLITFNNTTLHYDHYKHLPQLFEEQVIRTPHATALQYESVSLTYTELNEKVNRLANQLREKYGIHQLTGILLERSGMMVTAMLAILKSGGAYVPIDPDYPEDRIQYILTDSQVDIVLTQQQFLPYLQQVSTVILMDDAAICSAENPAPLNKSTDTAYIIYTSGSTGQPKGISVSHGNVTALMHWAYKEFQDSRFDVTFSATSYCFDLSVYEIFFTLTSGKRLRILASGADISRYLPSEKNILINTVPSVIETLQRENVDFSNVSVLNMAGEPVPYNVMAALDKQTIEVRNLYGPSETTTYSSCYRFLPDDERITIGKPIANTKIYIVDTDLRLVGPGITGEICISGDGVTKGYLGKEELTREKFLDDPYEAGKRLYRTGDMAKWLEDGNIHFLGRRDRLIKIRGYRIESGEIENRLLQYPGISTCAVDARKDAEGNALLLAWFTGSNDIPLQELKAYMAHYLPLYMLPHVYMQLDILPLTANGKTDLKRLPAPGDDISNTYIAPVTWMEKKLAGIWEDVLDRKTGTQDNFFETGGHSLKAIRMISRIYSVFGIQVSLRDIFNAPTVASLARVLTAYQQKGYYNIVKAPVQEDYPLSPMQRRLWIFDQMEGPSDTYNIPYGYRFRGNLNLPALELAFKTLVDRHEILRTRFIVIDGEPRQQINATNNPEISFTDLSAFEEKEEKAVEMGAAAAAHLFNLATGPLIYLHLLKMAAEDYVLLLSMHHIISDAWSMGILVKEIAALYEAFRMGLPDPLPPLNIQYKDFAVWQFREQADDHRTYWMNRFRGPVPVLDLPTDRTRPPIKSYRGDKVSFMLDKEMTIALQQIGRSENASLFMTLLATVHTLLYRYTGQEDIVIGTPVAGREHPELEDQIGFYVNTLALRHHFPGGGSFIELLRTIRENTLAAYEHQAYSFDQLIEELDIKRDASRSPLFDVLMVLQNVEGASSRSTEIAGAMPELMVNSFTTELKVSKYDLSFGFSQQGNYMLVELEYNPDLFDRIRIEKLRNHYWHLLNVLIEHSAVPLEQLQLSLTAERKQVQQLKADTEREYIKPATEQEMKLAAIWEDILGIKNISTRDNFFELGGHSLKALRLSSRIWKELNITIGLRDLFHFPTIETLIKAIHTKNRMDGLLLRLNNGTGTVNLFMIPPVMGSSSVFSELAAMLPDINCYGLQYKGFDYNEAFDESIESMAANFIREILAVQFSGEYKLLGYSMGACITFEIARQLEARQKKVKILLIDFPVERSNVHIQMNEAIFKQLAGDHFEKFSQQFSHYYKVLLQYKITGTIQADIIAMEATGTEQPANMKEWADHTTGSLQLQYLKGGHYDMLDTENLPLIADSVLSMTGRGKLVFLN